MGFITKLFSDSSDADFKLAQDLVAIAIADGEISEKERKAITDICRSEGVTEEVINDYLLGFDVGTTALVPTKRKEKTDYICKLIRIMGVDGQCTPMEIYLLEVIASKMGINHMELVSLVLMTATHRTFCGGTGTKALASFLQNVIDPKGKNLNENRDNIKKIFDLVAENIPQHQDRETDKAAFITAMDSATALLLENTILEQEFQSIGIDLKQVLEEERLRAIIRWVE